VVLASGFFHVVDERSPNEIAALRSALMNLRLQRLGSLGEFHEVALKLPGVEAKKLIQLTEKQCAKPACGLFQIMDDGPF
jgi:hypothetical protein